MTALQRCRAEMALIANWEDVVFRGDMEMDDMIESLTAQINGGRQGWDMSLEEFDDNPDLLGLMGYEEPLTDEQAKEWLGVVQGAAKIFLITWSGINM